MERIALIPDLHCSDQDDRAIDLTCKILEYVKPARLIFLGDILDYGWCSSYPQDQGELRGIFPKEIAAWEKVAGRFRSALPGAFFQAVPGNHDYRLQKGFIWKNPAFREWRALSYESILSLDRFRIQWVERPSAAIYLAGKRFVVTHGVRVRAKSGASAHGELSEEWWTSGGSGHTHRMGQVFKTTHRGIYCWTECGHLQKPRPTYAPINKVAPQDWQQGFVMMSADRNSFTTPSLIPFWRRGHRLHARYFDKEFQA